MCQKNTLQLLRNIWLQRVKSGKGFDQKIYQKLQIVAGGEGTCEVEFQVEDEHTNPAGLLHGGFSACLVDSVSTLALLTHPRQVPGVSVNLNMTIGAACHTCQHGRHIESVATLGYGDAAVAEHFADEYGKHGSR
ncbi:hypothetical protein GHT06_007736 [Daphnia sinensis]|uniref:Thioesterase domain-containing protein n=1 Tax=Daphnia sinensis TaxID=1820382 RepID=A0AAD5PZZ5_9CRUS|nr:hypothetical protein GHT06_007736 [Daphnia sinensis]